MTDGRLVVLATNHDVATRTWHANSPQEATRIVEWLGNNGIMSETANFADVNRLMAKEQRDDAKGCSNG